MENLMTTANIKALILSLLIFIFTYWYYSSQQPSFLSFGTAVFAGLISLILVLLGACIIRALDQLILSQIIYPHILFRFLQPFLILLLLFWLSYGIFYTGRFGYSYEFTSSVKQFFRLHLPYITVVCILLAIGLSLPFPSQKMSVGALFYNNIKFALCVAGIVVVSIFLIYWIKLIKQPNLGTKFVLYETLDNQFDLDGLEVKLLLDVGTQHHASEPYFLPDRNELIINALAESSNKIPPLHKSYKVDKEGKVIADLDTDIQFAGAQGPFTFEEGYIKANQADQLVTWVFDGNKEIRDVSSFSVPYNRIITRLTPDQNQPKAEYFYKTSKIRCADTEVKWNGTRYYTITYQGDTVRFKIDHVYLKNGPQKECTEQTVEYFECKGMNFDLIRLNEQVYYTIKQKRK
ncbi:hypothetical protein HMPREF0765_4335 [Sphingobacterium spiritivorum ATCC 33300]|uniref:Uncharacterized protein n=1 Tax=Sphingobacterium spiritivorum ATCC 33300 TaxID=525372 RepID=C2G429_SPHSI|nr:hypothetical protein [Sphingobacterium spiritivorum]EEI90075.1 hypothetical protein HMPREF0765_4335 [Sphingobacterium spiritivorum ATCC 33300]QQS95001.1 hypothetical protein I6J03_16705 [Sphingobacterium spiritivorum]